MRHLHQTDAHGLERNRSGGWGGIDGIGIDAQFVDRLGHDIGRGPACGIKTAPGAK